MPGWHDATEELQADGHLESLGVVVEQHPDRAALFMAYQRLDWPLLWDPFNLLELPAVPITMVLDPAGVIRLMQPKLDAVDEIAELIRSNGWEPVESPHEPESPVPGIDELTPPSGTDPERWSRHAMALVLWGGPGRIDEAVEASWRAAEGSTHGSIWFRHGVILRLRHDSPSRRDTDFAQASEAWTNALSIDPGNYIWRRRLQQYGPRLAKPYAFYDWVPVARQAIEERGETPPPLVTEPEGAEFAEPLGDDASSAEVEEAHPDPEGRVPLDDGAISVAVSTVPARVPPGDAVRIHLELAPATGGSFHWNNEAGPGAVWVEAEGRWLVQPRSQAIDVPAEPSSDETRHIEFEVRVPDDVAPGSHSLEAVLAFHVCEDETGVCMYRRRDVSVLIDVQPETLGLSD